MGLDPTNPTRCATRHITAIAAHNATNQFPYRVYGVRSEMYVKPV